MFVYLFKVTLEKFSDFFFFLIVGSQREGWNSVVKSALNVLEERVSLLKDNQLSWWFIFSQIRKEETKIRD